ncbi:hypothetical protein WS92_27150 [Burkholderia sp. MSMB1588]|nr:hypothetical protein WS92_27150 [Burkholderia sp. MSMB1588]
MFSTLSHVLPRVVTICEPFANAPFAAAVMTSPFRYGFWLLPYSTVCFPLTANDTAIVEPDWLGSEPWRVTSSMLSGNPL